MKDRYKAILSGFKGRPYLYKYFGTLEEAQDYLEKYKVMNFYYMAVFDLEKNKMVYEKSRGDLK